ncbi:MAG: tRNA dihydrouridine synthase DusB [Erysipelotrichales bacterium]|nr:tRNA dihydrouridine synthase DusB [Erysipelotrichales bacterium]
MKIGSIELKGNVILAPMAGITNIAYREYMKKFGVALSYTEMVSDCGLIYENKVTYKYLETSEMERPVAIQIFGGKKDTLLEALKIIENQGIDYDILDVNLGCPVPKVTKTGAGSAWLKRKDELFEMMSMLVKASSKPVTAKIRIGWDDSSINVEEIVLTLQKAGVALIAIHPRTRNQLYSGKANYERIKNIKNIMNIPLVISGDIFTLDDAISAQKITNADGIMVARGALGNPYLIKQIDHFFKTGERLDNPTINDQMNYLEGYAKMLVDLKGEYVAIHELRGIAPHFLKGYPNTKQNRLKLATEMETFSDLKKILEDIKASML